MMRLHTLSFLTPLVVLVLLATARGQGADTKPKSGLFSDDPTEVLAYLAKGYRIPHFQRVISGPVPDSPPIAAGLAREVDRAAELFKSGKSDLRLAIAKALCPLAGQRTAKFWDVCGPDDYLAQHYLVGLEFSVADPERKKALWQWLLNDADPGAACALLKNFRANDLQKYYATLPAPEADKIIPFLGQLYRQVGEVVWLKHGPGDYPGPDIKCSVQEQVVGMLPWTAAGRDLLLSWMAQDAKKLDDNSLTAAWRAWNIMTREQPGLFGDEFVTPLVGRRDVAEAWLLCKAGDAKDIWLRRLGDKNDTPLRGTFFQTTCQQVFNLDENVRTRAIRFLFWLPPDEADRACAFLKSIPEKRAVKQIMAEIRQICQELVADAKARHVIGDGRELEETRDKLLAALTKEDERFIYLKKQQQAPPELRR